MTVLAENAHPPQIRVQSPCFVIQSWPAERNLKGSGIPMLFPRATGSWFPVLAENVHPFEDPPLRMNNPVGLFGLIR